MFAPVVAWAGAAGGAVLVDAPWTNTAQIQTPLNNTLFGTLEHLAALNLHYGSHPVWTETLNGIGFHDVALSRSTLSPPDPASHAAVGVVSPTFYPGVTVDYGLCGPGTMGEHQRRLKLGSRLCCPISFRVFAGTCSEGASFSQPRR